MYTLLSLVTSVKDYVEVVHKLIETDPNWNLTTYYDFGATTTFVILSLKQMMANFFSLNWFQTIWSLPTLVPDMAASMISEISVLDGSFHNTLTFLETPLSYGNTNLLFYCLEKFMIGFVNSLFLCFPTSIAHIITLRRFVMQGLEAGYISGLGTIAGNLLWIGSIVFGLRFIVIPWLSFDILRYLLGFLLLIKYMWDSYTERRTVLEDLSKWKIFLLTFLLSFTEQTNLSPFLSNLSIGSDATPFESFPTQTFFEFVMVHGCYLMGIFVGSFSLLQLTCWFWENPAFNLYMWFLSSFKVTTSFYHKLFNLTFLYITMICAVSNMAYFGIDYTITHPLGMVHEDRLVDQKMLLETAFLNSKASDRNTRRNRGRHGRRERWKRRVRRYRTFDASLYDQGVYDLFTIEDLNYGFDRFWLRRKIRNHRVRFRFFPGPWMRSFKKQLSRPRLESFMGPRVEFFRILFEQAYHPSFHEFLHKKTGIASADQTNKTTLQTPNQTFEAINQKKRILSVYSDSVSLTNSKNQLRTGETSSLIEDLRKEKSALRKFVRKVNSRIQLAKIRNEIETMPDSSFFEGKEKQDLQNSTKPIYSKRWKYLFSKMSYGQADMPNSYTKSDDHLFQRFSKNVLWKNPKQNSNLQNYFEPSFNDLAPFMNAGTSMVQSSDQNNKESNFTKKEDVKKHLSKKDRQILRYKTFLTNGPEGMESVQVDSRDTSFLSFPVSSKKEGKETEKEELKKNTKEDMYRPMTLLHPIKFYLQKEQAFQRKLSFYGVKPFRNYGVENNAPYFRIMMKRFFYYYKPTLRWERTMRVATLRKARRKGPRVPRKPNVTKTTEALSLMSNPASVSSDPVLSSNVSSYIQKPTHFYSLVSKRASRYRFQIYKDVLQHWYYTPLNRLLLKFDVDSFIRRQPQTYFLNQKDEKFLHLKRTLLSEYYETLRWYTYMQHARTMKANIGGTKSLSSRAYNQQFQGTFKKIRHLFAITPSSTDYTVLKFDQPLYNEYSNDRNDSIVEDSVVHEELLADETIYMNPLKNLDPMRKTPEDLPNQSAKILREYLFTSAPLRQELIQKLLSEKNYWELTQFLFKGQKLRGTRPITNSTDFFNQEQAYLLPSDASMQNNSVPSFFEEKGTKQELWIALLKKAQNTLYDQESLKNYVSGRVEKHEKQKQRQEKQLKERLERMKQWFVEKKANNADIQTNDGQHSNAYTSNYSGLTSSIQKALKDGFFWEKGWTSPKFNLRNNRPNFYQHLDAETQASFAYNLPSKSIFLKDHLKNHVKQHALQTKKAEQDLKNQFASIQQNMDGSREKVQTQFQSVQKQWKRIQHLFFKPFQPIFFKSSSLIKGWIGMDGTSLNLKTQSQKNLSFWRQREMALSKRKKIRKTLKRLRNATNRKETTWMSSKNEPEDFIKYSLLPFSSFSSGQSPPFFSPFSKKKEEKGKKKTNDNTGDRKKRDLLPNGNDSNTDIVSNFETISYTKNQKDWRRFLGSSNSLQQRFMQSLKRKRTRLRRSRRFKARSPIKKSTLGEKFKRQFRLLKKYRQKDNLGSAELQAKQNRKFEIIQQITKRKYDPSSPFSSKKEEKGLKKEGDKGKSEFQTNETKQRRTRQRKHRFWKKHKKPKYATNRRKLRHQRRRYALNKIRALNKKLYRIQGNAQMKQWWWQTFLPNFQANKDALWQIQKNRQIQQQLSQLSVSEILERDQAFAKRSLPSGTIENPEKAQALQIGDKDYKPLAIPEALRIREQFVQKQLLNFGSDETSFQTNQGQNTFSSFPSEKQEAGNKTEQNAPSLALKPESAFASNSPDLIAQLSQSASSIPFEQTENRMAGSMPFSSFSSGQSPPFFEEKGKQTKQEENPRTSKTQTFQNFYEQDSSKFMVGTNPMPFYAGWDETLRQFVVTNRFLSRKEAGYLMNPSFSNSLLSSNNEVKAPLQGMNAATTLYWQIPFTTYDPDQFFALGMDGFSPIAWNHFHFKHSKQTTKPILVKNILSNLNSSNRSFSSKKTNIEDLQFKILSSRFKPKTQQNREFNTFKIHQYRRIQKRQKRLKKHPRPPVWFPSGPLTNQVLPVHYIYVFYKRSRLPRDRYIRRRLRRTPHVDIDQQSQLANQVFKNTDTQALRFDAAYDLSTIKDYTLRKRAKPRRKYHRTRQKTNPDTFFLKRRAFRAVQFYDTNTDTLNNNLPIANEHSLRFRPLSKIQATSVLSSKRTAFQSKTSASFFEEKRNRDKEGTRKSAKQSSENLRVRQLRRRVQRQVLRPISRYKPRAGGFVWPGDYLRFELVKAPKLQTFTSKLPVTEQSASLSVNPNLVGQNPSSPFSSTKEGKAQVMDQGLIESKTETSSKSRKIRKKKRRTIQEWQIQPKQYLLQKHNRKVLKKRLEKSQNLAQMHQKVQQFQYLWNN